MKTLITTLAIILSSSLALGQTQREMNDQASKDYTISDKKLGKTYNELLRLLTTKKEKDLLIAAERSWIIFRDAHAHYAESFYEGGSMQPLIYFGAMKELTDTRTKQLQESLDELKGR